MTFFFIYDSFFHLVLNFILPVIDVLVCVSLYLYIKCKRIEYKVTFIITSG